MCGGSCFALGCSLSRRTTPAAAVDARFVLVFQQQPHGAAALRLRLLPIRSGKRAIHFAERYIQTSRERRILDGNRSAESSSKNTLRIPARVVVDCVGGCYFFIGIKVLQGRRKRVGRERHPDCLLAHSLLDTTVTIHHHHHHPQHHDNKRTAATSHHHHSDAASMRRLRRLLDHLLIITTHHMIDSGPACLSSIRQHAPRLDLARCALASKPGSVPYRVVYHRYCTRKSACCIACCMLSRFRQRLRAP